jgi:hypothetical protein
LGWLLDRYFRSIKLLFRPLPDFYHVSAVIVSTLQNLYEARVRIELVLLAAGRMAAVHRNYIVPNL